MTPRRPALLLAALLPAARPARAHALITRSVPANGARLPGAPAEAALFFNSRIDHARSRLSLAPQRVAAGGSAEERPLVIEPGTPDTELRAPLPPLATGPWRLRWQVLALDGHITRGDIRFTVGAP